MTGQGQLFIEPVDERVLADIERTVLEAIDHLGSITARQAGQISYRMRGWQSLLTIQRGWLISAGRRLLDRLERDGLVRRQRGHWKRQPTGGTT